MEEESIGMKIKIKAGRWNIPIWIPNGLILNKFTAKKIVKLLEEEVGTKINPAAILRFKKEIREFKKRNPDWKFIEVESEDGPNMEILL